jgi:hypothetical protein
MIGKMRIRRISLTRSYNHSNLMGHSVLQFAMQYLDGIQWSGVPINILLSMRLA